MASASTLHRTFGSDAESELIMLAERPSGDGQQDFRYRFWALKDRASRELAKLTVMVHILSIMNLIARSDPNIYDHPDRRISHSRRAPSWIRRSPYVTARRH